MRLYLPIKRQNNKLVVDVGNNNKKQESKFSEFALFCCKIEPHDLTERNN